VNPSNAVYVILTATQMILTKPKHQMMGTNGCPQNPWKPTGCCNSNCNKS